MQLYFDTETNGLPLWREPSNHPDQPHLVQVAALLCDGPDDDGELLDVIIRPDGWLIDGETAAIHGISHERALHEGIPEHEALRRFMALASRAGLRVAHNYPFDARIMRIALKRYRGQMAADAWSFGPPSYCTMRKSTALCALPATEKMIRAGFKWPKSPKLGEAYRILFGEELLGAHDAAVDLRACRRIHHHLVELERVATTARAGGDDEP